MKNLPIQLFCVISTLGDFTPLKFRYENEEHHIITVPIEKILASKESSRAGQRELIYTCRAAIDDRYTIFDLKYNIATHKWFLKELDP